MGIFTPRKYKLIRKQWEFARGKNSDYFGHRTYRLKAVRDIPEHGVKAGDLGGLVSRRNTLSHKGSCWVGYNAEVLGWIDIFDDVYIGDKASVRTARNTYKLVIKDKARITGNAIVESAIYSAGGTTATKIQDNVQIYGNAVLENAVYIFGNAKIHGDAVLKETLEVSGDSEISGKARISKAKILGSSKIHGNAIIEQNATITNSDISGDTVIVSYSKVIEKALHGKANMKALDAGSGTKSLTFQNSRMLTLYTDIKSRLATYETDVVKIIKYPTMTDRSIASTLDMNLALSSVERLLAETGCDEAELSKAVRDLEAKFMVAESNAIKMASTTLSEAELKKVEKAKDLLAIAADDASTDNEKKASFNQAFKQLEGIIMVPEIAVDTFRIKVGLQEIEA